LDIVDAMLTVKELMLSPDGTAAEAPPDAVADADAVADDAGADVAGAVVVELVEDEHPAAATATTAAAATQRSRGKRLPPSPL
jgi:hypothetical protein